MPWDTSVVNWLVTTLPTHFQLLPNGQLAMLLPNHSPIKLPHHYQSGLALILLDPNPLGKLLGLLLLTGDRHDFLRQTSYSKLN